MFLLEQHCDPKEEGDDGLTIGFWMRLPRADTFRGPVANWGLKPTQKDLAAYQALQRAASSHPEADEILQWGVDAGALRRGCRVGSLPLLRSVTPFS